MFVLCALLREDVHYQAQVLHSAIILRPLVRESSNGNVVIFHP